MKRAFMIVLFAFVLVILVAFLLKYNQYRSEVENEDLSNSQIMNDELFEKKEDFNFTGC